MVDFPSDQLRFLVYGRVADNALLKERFGFTPVRTTREALQEFVQSRRFHRLVTPQRAERWERDLYEFLRRTRTERVGG